MKYFFEAGVGSDSSSGGQTPGKLPDCEDKLQKLKTIDDPEAMKMLVEK